MAPLGSSDTHSATKDLGIGKGMLAMPNNQPQWNFSIYDPGYPRSVPNTSTPARGAAVSFESGIRHDQMETGAFFHADGSLIVKKVGTPNKVQFSAIDLAGTDGTLFTHNHPEGFSFSIQDVQVAVAQKLVELRAVAPSWRHMMRPSSTWPSFQSIRMVAQNETTHVRSDVGGMVQSGQLQRRFADLEILHLIWERVSHKLGFEYFREAS